MREEGYYWIKTHETSDWEISEFNEGKFYIMCDEFSIYEEHELFEIDEKRIIRG